MDNDEIKALLRELKARSDESNEVKGTPITINLEEEKPPAPKKDRGLPLFKRKKQKKQKAAKLPENTEAAEAVKQPEENEKQKAVKQPEENEKQETVKLPEEDGKQGTVEHAEKTEEPKAPVIPEMTELSETEGKITEDLEFEEDEADFRETDELFLEAKKNGAVGRSPWKNLKLAVKGCFRDLKEKGIGNRELIMIGSGAVLLIFLGFAIFGAMFGEDKSVNVTADEGLVVTVEAEPETWCKESPVTLGIRSRAAIQSITVNGKAAEFESGRRTQIEVNAETHILQLMVVTETSVLNASVEIPMLDSEAPSVKVHTQEGQVVLEAVEERSGLSGIYYGTAVGFSDVPAYQKYTGPFSYEQGKLYYYYAEDIAGNRSVPVCTSLEPAQSLMWKETEITLFPGDSASLQLFAVPQYAYYNQLNITNLNPEIVALSENGTVTAIKEGDAVIQAEAEGLPGITCRVQVRSEAEVTITAVGDCTLGDDIYFSSTNSFSTVYHMYGESWFFQNVRSILEEDDITFANFEGTLTTADTRQEKQYAFKGDPSYAGILKDGSIEVVTLANNHSSDYGQQSLSDTKASLASAGIDYCMGDTIAYREVKGARVALIGIYVLDTGIEKAEQVERTVAEAKRNGADLIVVGFHWGSEKSTAPDEVQQSLAHTAIDCGADLVVGHHPHVLQGIEQYQGKYIVYSLGNFCFGGNSNPSDKDTMIFRETFVINGNGEIKESRITIIPCSVTSEYGWNNYQPTPQEGSEADRIMGRINEYSAPFGLIYES